MTFSSAYSFLLTLVLCAVFGSAGAPAQAQQTLDDERAKAHFFAGESHFAAERWGDAEREFALAYELSGRPEMLINLSRAQERNGQLAEAIGSLELLIAKHPKNAYRGEAENRIASMRKTLAEQKPEPVAAPLDPAPVVVAAALPQSEPATAEPLPPVALTSEPVSASVQEGRTIWPPSLVTSAIGGAAVLTAIVSLATGLRAHHIHKDLDDRCGGNQCAAPFADDRDHGQALARTSTAFTFVSLALAGTAAVLWVYDVKKRDQPSSLALGIDGSGARMRAEF